MYCGKAKVINRTPFTIQLLYHTTEYVQPISLGVDSGSKHIGISATTKDKVLFEAEVEEYDQTSRMLQQRAELRRSRRCRKTRYREARFNNRRNSKPKGWIAPSIRHTIQTHLTIIERVHKILPISNIIVEIAEFDIHKIKNPDINGKEYQEGEMKDYYNVKHYILDRDNHTCEYCKGKSKCYAEKHLQFIYTKNREINHYDINLKEYIENNYTITRLTDVEGI